MDEFGWEVRSIVHLFALEPGQLMTRSITKNSGAGNDVLVDFNLQGPPNASLTVFEGSIPLTGTAVGTVNTNSLGEFQHTLILDTNEPKFVWFDDSE